MWNEAVNSRSGPPALERTAMEAPASGMLAGGSVFRGRSLGTRI